MPDEAVPLLAGLSVPLHHVVPAAALPVAADLRHHRGDLARQLDVVRRFGRRLLIRIRFQAIFRLWPDDGAVLLPAPGVVVRPVLVEALVDERAVLVVGEVVDDRVGGEGQEVGVAFLAGRQTER